MFFRLGRLLRAVGHDAVVLWFACRNPATPAALKLAALAAALYLVSPIDILPDWLLLLGLADDIALLALAVPFLLKFVPSIALSQAHAAADTFLTRFRLGLR